MEVHDFYCSEKLNTGLDVRGRRIRRIHHAIEKCWQDYDEQTPPKVNLRPGQYVGLLKALISEQQLKGTQYRYRIRYEDVDLFLSGVTERITRQNIGNLELFGTVSVDAIKTDFKITKEKGWLKSKADDQKVAAMRSLCVAAGLIVLTDDTWVHRRQMFSDGGSTITTASISTSRSMKYALGAKHPKLTDFTEASQRHQGIVRPSVKQCSTATAGP